MKGMLAKIIDFLISKVRQHGVFGCIKICIISFFYRHIISFYTLITFRVAQKLRKPNFINIAGGPNFHAHQWLNLEVVQSKFNPKPFELSPDCQFPVAEGSIHTVYTSHCLEHLDVPTVFRVLAEVYRVLKSDGRLIIKIPDFDEVLERWQKRDATFFDERWDYKSATYTWNSRQIPDCLDYRAAMLFCGFWNEEYGDHYSGKILQNEFAYHGPPVVRIEFLQNLMKNHTPSQISAELREVVLKNEKGFTFNHQNAWSRQEFETLLIQTGFRIKSFDKEFIIANCKYIPGMNAMKDQSIYCLAEKEGASI